MEVKEHTRVSVGDASAAGGARRVAIELAQDIGMNATDVGRLAIVVSEAASNIVKHGGGGEVLLRVLGDDAERGVGVLALDRGPGLANVAGAMRDGFSSAGTSGTGLGAIRRQSTLFDTYSAASMGFALFSTVSEKPRKVDPGGLLSGGINVPYPGEEVSGDAWSVSATGGRHLVLVCDGLGHGVAAAAASAVARETFHRHLAASPEDMLERIHEALRPTRGAAVAVAEIDRRRREVRFAGIGNIMGTIVADGATRSVVSHHGTAGHDVRRIQGFSYPWPASAMLVLHSDGLQSRWTLERYPGLAARHPALTAAVLYRDFRRERDDTSVVALRDAE